jgi:Protein of unknown function (DUF1194)
MSRRTGLVLLALCGLLAAFAARPPDAPAFSGASAERTRLADADDVDVELILAVDVSYSMDPDEQALQREGYVSALTSPEFLTALKAGIHARIAITYFEWANANDQKILLPWRLIDGPVTARAVADEISRAAYRRAYRTSIAGALLFGSRLFESSGHRGIRRVIDVSGDGTNNEGPLIVPTREAVVANGITVNGLPIMLKKPQPGSIDIEDLDIYYEDCVIGGPGAFVVPIKEREKFKDAVRTKLVLEVAGHTPAVRIVPAAEQAPRISCTIGERMWQQRWGNGLDLR